MESGLKRSIFCHHRAVVAFATVLALSGFQQDVSLAAKAPDDHERRQVFSHAIESPSDFEAYSRVDGPERFTKLILDLETDQIYYFDVNTFGVHADFILSELSGQWKTEAPVLKVIASLFNRWQVRSALQTYDENYGVDKPRFMMCTLVHHVDQDLYSFAFWEGDQMGASDVHRAYRRIRETFHLGDELHFRPNSTRQEQLIEAGALADIPTVTNDTLYRAAPYRAFSVGSAIGRLRIPGSDSFDAEFAPDEIAILTETPPDISPVRGIISERFSSPLSHLALRARGWGVPHVRMEGAAETYADLEGKWVVFEAESGSATIRPASDAEVRADHGRRAMHRKVRRPSANQDERRLKRLTEIQANDAGAYGATTANLGEIAAAGLDGVSVPDGFGIPLVYYAEHLERAGLDERIDALLGEARFREDAAYRTKALAALRTAILSAPIHPDLQERIDQRVEELSHDRGSETVVVRASSNAEDASGFNGAGLYDTVPNVKGSHAVSDAVKRVWASVWNKRAYEEREHFAVDQREVSGAVLVQAGVNATATGVIITSNIFDPSDHDLYTITAESGLGLRAAERGAVPEQLLFDTVHGAVRVLTRSDEETMVVFDPDRGVKEVANPNHSQPVLTDERTRRLGESAQAVAGLFPKSGPLDIKWLVADEQVHIVQARPYTTPNMVPTESERDAFGRALERFRVSAELPGAVAAYEFRDGRRGVAAAGVSDLATDEPMIESSRLPAGSLGKTFVAALTLQLAHQGKIDLDAPLGTWLSDAPWYGRLANTREATPRMLLNHSSGVPDYAMSRELQWASLLRRLRELSVDARFDPHELLELMVDSPADFPPGTGHRYSDSGYLLLGLMIEKVTGRRYYDLVRERFFVRHGLDETEPTEGLCYDGLATGHLKLVNPFLLPSRVAADGCMKVHPGTEWTGGGIVTSAPDVVRWVQILWNGDALEAPYLDEMLKSRSQVREGVYWGLGVQIFEDRHGPSLTHAGWLPGYVSQVIYLRDHEVAIALLVNGDYGADIYQGSLQLADSILPDTGERLAAATTANR